VSLNPTRISGATFYARGDGADDEGHSSSRSSGGKLDGKTKALIAIITLMLVFGSVAVAYRYHSLHSAGAAGAGGGKIPSGGIEASGGGNEWTSTASALRSGSNDVLMNAAYVFSPTESTGSDVTYAIPMAMDGTDCAGDC
jgi:hypothetical protein